MAHSSTLKISILVSLLLIFVILLAFSLFKYLQRKQQVTATLSDDEQPPAIQGNATPCHDIIPISQNINIPRAELLKLICGISTNENSNAPIIRGITPDRSFRNIPIIKINEMLFVGPESLLYNYNKLSQIVATSIPYNSYQSLPNNEKTIMDIAKKHIESIQATLNIQNKECCRIFHNRITIAAILEDIFNRHWSLTPNISIIHELVNHYNLAGEQHRDMPLKFLKLVFKECPEIDISKATTQHAFMMFKEVKTTGLNCSITTNVIIPYKGINEKLGCILEFTIRSQDPQDFSQVCYENISLILLIPNRMNLHITSPSSTNNSFIANADSARLTSHTPSVQHGNRCTQLKYSFPNLQQPLLMKIENIYHILDDIQPIYTTPDDVPPAIQTTSPSSADTPCDDITSRAELLKLICGISTNENPNAHIIRGITPDRSFRNIPIIKINEMQCVEPEPLLENYNKLSQIVETSIPVNSYQSLPNDEKIIIDIAKKHIESIQATLNIQNEECCRIFHNRITTAAILEDIFNRHWSLTPNISIIHELVNHYNPAGGRHCYMPLKFLELVFKECPEIDISKATNPPHEFMIFKEKTTGLNCCITTSVMISYKGKDEKLACILEFTIRSPDSQDFSHVYYENITLTVFIPNKMNLHITSPSSTNNSFIANADSAKLTSHPPSVQQGDLCTQLKYSFPNLQPPLLMKIENIYHILCDIQPIYTTPDDVPPAIQTTSPSSAATPCDDIISISKNINISQAELLKLICGISTNENSNAPIIRGITLDRSFRNIPLIRINERPFVGTGLLLENYNKLSQIVATSIPDNSYQSLPNDEKTIMDIAKKHIESIKATLNIQNEECCRIFHNRITIAAILEDIFNRHLSLTPNISIIHELVNHYNPAEEQHRDMPLKFLELVFKECPEIDISKARIHHAFMMFKEIKTTGLNCSIITSVIIPYKGINEKLTCKLEFTIRSPDSQDFSHVCYENISSILSIPNRMNLHITSPSMNHHTRSDHLISIIGCIPDVQADNNNYTKFKYSVPNLQPPLLISKQNFNAACGLASTSIENYQHTTQQHC
ncbi:hypothetical protein [Ehrlichia muris]|uniref:Uncharacterized protein n=1 Tax=Ehrlichia muris AS145 TaxID=1423892 RepID=V9R8P9_9RICK|nr:hypothetical protein [Ehrlichia muris]AHC39673.1 hypothetical protein EMUR_01155 [Ehrlichia muris AS145]